MKSVAARRWSCRLLGALLGLLAADLCAPAARAGCGSHVLVGDPAARQPAPGPIPGSEQHAPAPDQAPCSGPHCSKAPATPAPAPVSLSAPAEPQWALVSAPPDPPGLAPLWTLAEQPSGRSVRAGADVFHPPR